jgi:hypothetical protein
MDINESTDPSKWRLVHDGARVIAVIEPGGITTTIHVLFEADSREACEAEIDRLGLRVPVEPA